MISKRPAAKKPRKRSVTELSRLRAIREQFQRERPSLKELVAGGDYAEPVPQQEYLLLLELAGALKQARQAKRLSLADVAKRSGIDKAALSRIENGQNANPTLGTLQTLARALGVRLRFQLDETR